MPEHGPAGQQLLVVDRVIEVLLGVTVGVVVNLAVIPPLRYRQAARHVDRVGQQMWEAQSDTKLNC